MSLFRIFILIAFVDAVRSQCNGKYVTLDPTTDGLFRTFKSPNYGTEHGKRSWNCSWIINLPSPKHYVTMYLEDLRLHYADNKNIVHCMPSYNLTINGERFGCEPDQFVSTERSVFPIQFRTSTCAHPNNSGKIRQIVDKVQVAYSSNGQRAARGQIAIMIGFRIRYGVFYCPGFRTSIPTNRRTVTPTILSTSTQHPFHSVPVNRNSIGRPQATKSTPRKTTALSTQISTTRTTATKTTGETSYLKAASTTSKSSGISSAKADSSNQNQVAVSSASNVTRRLQLTSTTPPTANKSRGEDDFDSEVALTIDMHWIILASALGGGLLLILVVGICCCKIQRNKKSKVESEETGTEDSSSNQDKTELPAYSTVEDISSNQKSSQQEETTNQNASQTDSKVEEKQVVENVAYEASQESPTTSASRPESTSAESIHNDEDKPTIVDDPVDEFYSVVRLKSNKEKTTVRYLKENILYSDAP